jgi:hypothetical protein
VVDGGGGGKKELMTQLWLNHAAGFGCQHAIMSKSHTQKQTDCKVHVRLRYINILGGNYCPTTFVHTDMI